MAAPAVLKLKSEAVFEGKSHPAPFGLADLITVSSWLIVRMPHAVPPNAVKSLLATGSRENEPWPCAVVAPIPAAARKTKIDVRVVITILISL